MYTPRLAIDRCKDLCLRATNRQTEDKKWSSANFARTDHALPGFALARLHLSWIFIVGQLCTIQERLWRKWSLASNLVFNTALIKYEEMAGERLSKEESIRYLREVHVWIVLMFSASKEIKQDNVGVEFSDQPRPAWAAIQLLAGRFKVLELAWGPQCQF